jgi:hypothetical protein
MAQLIVDGTRVEVDDSFLQMRRKTRTLYRDRAEEQRPAARRRPGRAGAANVAKRRRTRGLCSAPLVSEEDPLAFIAE